MADHQNWQSYESLEPFTYKSDGALHTDQSRELDLQYLTLREQIINSKYYTHITKHLRIRLNGWMQKLDQIITNSIWKKNRNTYAKLINLMCQCEVVVEPFNSLPPQNDVPKLNKHEINRIIDEVEREVKIIDKSNHKGLTKDKNDKTSNLRPEEFWNRVKRANNNVKQHNTEQESIYLGKFTSIQEKYREPSNISNTYENFCSMTEGNLSSKVSQQKKVYFSDIKDKDCHKNVQQFAGKQNVSLCQAYGRPPKHIMVLLSPNLHASQNIPQQQSDFSSKFKQNVIEADQKQSCLQAFRDAHVSMQLQSQTLKTEMFEHDLSIHPQMMQDFSQISFDECDYTDQLSQRFRLQPQITTQPYFPQKVKEKPCI